MDETNEPQQQDMPREPGREAEGIPPRSPSRKASEIPQPAIMQRENERSRVIVDGKRTADGGKCTLVVVQETGGTWALYPHGWGKFGVRLHKDEAIKAAQAILHGAQ